MKNKPKDKQKIKLYNLVYKARQKGFRVDHQQRTIYYEWTAVESTKTRVVNRLIKEFNFELQSEIR